MRMYLSWDEAEVMFVPGFATVLFGMLHTQGSLGVQISFEAANGNEAEGFVPVSRSRSVASTSASAVPRKERGRTAKPGRFDVKPTSWAEFIGQQSGKTIRLLDHFSEGPAEQTSVELAKSSTAAGIPATPKSVGIALGRLLNEGIKWGLVVPFEKRVDKKGVAPVWVWKGTES